LVLTGENDYDGGTRVEGGTLKGNIRDDTDLSVLAGAVYDGADQARSVAVLDGGGTIKNTDGLAVASGNFSGNIDSSNDGGLIKDGNGVLILSGNNQYGGGTTVADGTLKGNITEGTDLTIASTAVYHGDDKARTVGKLNGEGSVRNTAGMTVSSGDFSGSIDSSNVGGLTKETGGELILSGNNQYAGETKVAGGTLKGNIASGTDLTIASGAAYHGNDQARKVSKLDGEGTVRHTDGLTVSSGTFSGSIDGSNEGGLTKESGGELVLSGQNEYKGSTTITAGRLTGNIAEGTDLAIASAGVYDGAQAERTVSSLSGFGSIVNTVGLIVSSGTFGGNIDDTNTGGLTKVDDGDLYLTGDNSYAGGTVISGGSLIGDSASLKGDIANGAVLAFVQNEDRTFEGNITGSGDILKLGIGALVFDSDQSAGQVEISGGSLIVGGSVSQSAVKLQADTVNVNANAILGGHGTIESNVVVHEGGLLSPGNSYGKQTIAGDLEFKPDSVFEIEVNPLDTSDSDIVNVRGTATLAGTFRHVATSLNADDYLKTGNEWLILDAAGMSGKFDAEESTLAFLLPHLRYDYSAADVFLSFTRRGATFGDYANTRNGRSVAAALESLDYGSELYRQIVSSATTDQAPGLLDDLSGEMHGAVTSGLFGIGRGFANMLSRHVAGLSRVGSGYQAPAAGSPGEGGNSFWAVAGGTHTVLRGTAETARTTMVGPEVSVGYDHSFDNGWLAGLAFQYGHKKVKTGARHSEAEVDSLTVGVYGGREIRLGPGLLRLVLSGAYSHHDVDSTRKVTIGTQTQTLDASYTARSIEGSLEAAYRFPVSDSFHLEPYVSIGMQRLRLGGFSETGGSAALTSVARSWNHAVSTAGLRLLLAANDRVSFGANLGWQHTFGNLVSTATYAFREGGRGFTVNSSPMNRNEALVGLDLGVKVSDNVNLSLGYNGSLGNQGQSHGGMAMVEVKW
jgi:autotransporter-associated beta strand protein